METRAETQKYVSDEELIQEWYSLDDACRRKGINKKTTQNLPWLQPNGGKPDGIVGRRKRWHRETIAKWLLQTDEELERS